MQLCSSNDAVPLHPLSPFTPKFEFGSPGSQSLESFFPYTTPSPTPPTVGSLTPHPLITIAYACHRRPSHFIKPSPCPHLGPAHQVTKIVGQYAFKLQARLGLYIAPEELEVVSMVPWKTNDADLLDLNRASALLDSSVSRRIRLTKMTRLNSLNQFLTRASG